MAVKGIIRKVGLAALAAGIATAALPSAAIAAPGEEGGRFERRAEERTDRAERRQAPADNGGGWSARNSAPAAAQIPQQSQVQPTRNWNGGERRGGWNGGESGGNWRGGSPQSTPPAQARTQPTPTVPVQSNWRGGDNDRGRDNAARQSEPQRYDRWRGRDGGNDRGNWSGRDNGHNNDSWRGHDDRRRNDHWRRNDNWRQADHRSWNRDWRRDNRYDWYRWRNNHRDTYRLGRYYPPYRGWSYRRLSIGFYLDNLFFGSSYWIDSPWMYRLPDAHGPYRWVRYYDDAVLVNIYNGEVVDVIYDFFW